MDKPESAPIVDVEKLNIDSVNVTGASNKDHLVQTLNALTPLLTVLITTIGIVVGFCFQAVQTKTNSADKQDAAWRAALDKISSDDSSSDIGIYEVATFSTITKYRTEARSVEAAKLPAFADKYEFDAIFALMLKETDETSQNDILAVARNESNRLRDLYSTAVKQLKDKPNPPTESLEDFILRPNLYFSEDDQQGNLALAWSEDWELESVSKGLSRIWGPPTKGLSHLNPGKSDLEGIIFINNDFRGIDFSQTSMNDADFIGTCLVERAKFPTPKPNINCQSKAK